MAEKKSKWWPLLILVLAVTVTLLIAFRHPILIYVVPKAALTSALADTAAQLDERFQYNPIRNTLDVFNPQGQYTAVIELNSTDDLMGDISYDMTIQTAMHSHQLFAEGTVGFSERDLELSLYLNGDFMAISSEELLNGNYYGITYDTFSSDVASFPFLKFLIPNSTMQKWEESIANIQKLMNHSYETPQITEKDIQMLIAGILLLDSHVDKETIQLNGQSIDCYRINYSASGEDVIEILNYLLDTSNVSSGKIAASFYLYEDMIVRIDLSGTAGESGVAYTLMLGENALTDDLVLTEKRMENLESSSSAITIHTQGGSRYIESLDIRHIASGLEKSSIISYDWDTTTGDMSLTVNNMTPIQLSLTRTETGINVATDDFSQLMDILLQKETEYSKESSCTLTLSKGSSIAAKPQYKNLDQWSMDDILVLLSNIGSLVGINLG